MAEVKQLISEEQVATLQEVANVLNAAGVDERTIFPVTIDDGKTKQAYFANREQFLEDTIEWALNTLGATFDFLE